MSEYHHAIDRIITITMAAERIGVCHSTLRRMLNAGTGPRTIKLSPRRYGIRESDFRSWLETRPEAYNRDGHNVHQG